jgi:RNA polymerase sigma-70 factor (ECF subfamily)
MMQAMVMPQAIPDEGALVRAAAAGDRAAFGALYERYARMVHAILLVRVPPGDAEDLVQEVFLSAMRQLRGLRDADGFRGWLGAIARNKAMDHHRAARKLAPIEDAPALRAAASPDGFLVLDRIRSLPDAYRETLIMRLVEGMTGPEIAERTGLKAESVRVNLCRGMKMLRELLEAK